MAACETFFGSAGPGGATVASETGEHGRRLIRVSPLLGEADPASGVKTVLPRHTLPDGPTTPSTPSRLIRDEPLLDVNPRLNPDATSFHHRRRPSGKREIVICAVCSA